MVDFLVTAKGRRRMLQLLFAERAAGSTAELAERARVAFPNAYRELRAMVGVGLARSKRVGGAEVFAANEAHPLAEAVGRRALRRVGKAAEGPPLAGPQVPGVRRRPCAARPPRRRPQHAARRPPLEPARQHRPRRVPINVRQARACVSSPPRSWRAS